jgi:hypothetical protein
LACGILASLGPRNVYKDMLNNMVSPIDHVVMNHQNQTRTNGKWGHVRYNLVLGRSIPATAVVEGTAARMGEVDPCHRSRGAREAEL